MSFLLPAAWWLGLLALPVVAFYLLKTRQRRKPTSTLIFWKQIKPKIENSPLWRKLRRWLSLLLQLLILALVVAALARPAFDWEKKNAQRVVAILDPSASMQSTSPAPSRWQLATDALGTAISRLRTQDEMAIITAENPPRILSGWTSSQRALREAAKHAAVLPVATDPSAALSLAHELTTTREGTRIEMFSDSVWPAGAWSGSDSSVKIIGVDAKAPANAGLTLFAVRRSPVSPGDWQLDAEVVSPTTFSGTLEILRDGQPMDLAAVQCGPDATWRKSWRGSTEGAAKLEAVLKVSSSDMLPADNRAACELPALKPLRVCVVGNDDPFLDALLDSIPLIKWTHLPKFPSPVPADLDLIIATGDALPDAAPKIPLLLIAPTKSGFWGELSGTIKGAPITDIDKKSPYLRHAGLSAVTLEESGQWAPPAGAAVLASAMGHPLLFGEWDRDPRWMVIGFNPGKSDLPLRTAFPVFMGNLLQSLRSDVGVNLGASVLPGRVESELHPLAQPDTSRESAPLVPTFPGWWLVLLGALALLVTEWILYSRRITD